MDTLCTVCGLPIAVGEWPCVTRIRPHGKSVQTNVFTEYFDIGLGQTITTLAQRKTLMRQHKMDYRDHPSRGTLSARRDRVEEQRREQARG